MSTSSTPLTSVRAREAMHAPLVAVNPAAELRDVARLMDEHRVHAVIVDGIQDEHLVWGVVSADDLIGAALRNELDATAGRIAGHEIVTVDVDDDLRTVCALMSDHETDHVLVVSGQRPVGVISALDIVRVLER